MDAIVMKDASKPRISVVYAAYNESAAIRETIARSVQSLRKQFDEFEVLIVDDCGSDGTGKIADELAREYPNEVRVLHNDRNRGQGASLVRGFREARYELMVPVGTRVEASGVSGDVTVRGTRAAVEVSSVSGDVEVVDAASRASINSVSGEVTARGIAGDEGLHGQRRRRRRRRRWRRGLAGTGDHGGEEERGDD
jgi:glycosyltransferase involved in cell wall biosynthesis